MKKTFLKLTTMLALVIACCMSITNPVSAATKTKQISGTGKAGNFIKVTTTEVADQIKPYTDTQTKHRKGYTTTIQISTQRTKSSTSSATVKETVGVTYLETAMELTVAFKLAEKVSITADSTISYTIEKTVNDGRYRIVAVFPSYKTNYFVYHRDGTLKQTTILDKTISHMPNAYDKYIDLQRYAD